MPRNSLKSLMDMFPWFFDKSSASNFYKSQDVTNRRFQELYNDLFKVKESFRLNKRLLVWKTQTVPYNYTINFVSSFPNLKTVKIYKDDNLVHREDFVDDGTSSFEYYYSYDTRNEFLFSNPDDEDSEVVVVSDEVQGLLDRLLFWRIDVDDLNFDVNLQGSFSHLKSVTLYKNGTSIYTNSYEDSADETSIEYSYRNTITNIGVDDENEENESVDDVFYVEIELWNTEDTLTKYLPQIEPQYITSSRFLIEVETYDEYHLFKGWPENDNIQEDHYDHDESLDSIGAQNRIPRKQYIPIDTLGDYYTSEPPFNNRLTEDDYHYMKRMLEYNVRLHTTPAPVLEIWKMYGIDAVMLNRERYLLKWFDVLRHPHHKETRIDPCSGAEYETLIVDDWTPEPWEHKDKWVDGKSVLGEYFYASASTVRPIKKQPVNFIFKVLNSLAEDISNNYTVAIFLNDEPVELDDTVYANQQWKCNPDLLDEDNPNVFTFVCKDGESNDVDSVEITINVRGCDDADFYVSSSGSDSNDGSITHPFATLQKALNSINGNLDLIAIYGSITIPEPCIVRENCTIIGCETAEITNLTNPRFFYISQDKQLTVQDITFIKGSYSTLIDTQIFTNENRVNETITAILETEEYDVLIEDLIVDKFIKDLTLDQETGVLSWKEVPTSDFNKLSDFDGVVTNLNLELDDDLTFIEYSSEGEDNLRRNSPYAPVEELTGAVFSITDDESSVASDGLIHVSEYGDELYEYAERGVDEFEIQHICSVTQVSLTQTSGDSYNLVLSPSVLHPIAGQSITFELNTGEVTSATYADNTDYTIPVNKNTSRTVRIVFERFVDDGVAYLGCEKVINIEWS